MSASKLVLQEFYFLDSTLWHYHFRLIFVSFFVLIVFGRNKQIEDSILIPGMDRNELHADPCIGSTRSTKGCPIVHQSKVLYITRYA
ncbi:hypothetical protein V6N13_072783 [Hibiscus sabdariffa]|uniref:Uncharacterized protein n=1 Tax=Hibiscus sabdariffa TaxID=183260 RepID=A0ABR2E759_9ROSI